MTDTDFLRAIIADPDADAPRLVYSDWLDENGQVERSEFIRVQLELAKFGDDGLPVAHNLDGRCNCRLCVLRRREKELLEKFAGDWSGLPYRDWTPKAGGTLIFVDSAELFVTFHRGFIETIRCSFQVWQQHADAIRAATPLRNVVLTTWPDWAQCCSIEEQEADMKRLLEKRWPGIEFELLPSPEISADDIRQLWTALPHPGRMTTLPRGRQ